jgi:hypothetical protein
MNHHGSDPSATGKEDVRAMLRGNDPLRADLKAYLDGELSWPRRFLVRWHLTRCPECREEMAWLQRLGEDMKDLEKARPRPELRARILASLPDTPPGRLAGVKPGLQADNRRFLRPALAGAFLALAVCGVFALNRSLLHPAENAARAALPDVATGKLNDGNGGNAPNQALAADSHSHAAEAAQRNLAASGTTDYEDEISRKAEEIVRRGAFAEAEQRRQLIAKNQAQIAAILSKVQGRGGSDAQPSIRMALAVNDVETTRAYLQMWAQKVGGGPVTDNPTPGGSQAAPGVPMELGKMPTGGNGMTKAMLPREGGMAVALRVPTERARQFLTGLQPMGAISRLPASAPAANRPMGAALQNPHVAAVLPPIADDAAAQASAKLLEKPAGTRSKLLPEPALIGQNTTDRQQRRDFVTITVVLRPTNSVSQ